LIPFLETGLKLSLEPSLYPSLETDLESTPLEHRGFEKALIHPSFEPLGPRLDPGVDSATLYLSLSLLQQWLTYSLIYVECTTKNTKAHCDIELLYGSDRGRRITWKLPIASLLRYLINQYSPCDDTTTAATVAVMTGGVLLLHTARGSKETKKDIFAN
jgi:hypothetical protein